MPTSCVFAANEFFRAQDGYLAAPRRATAEEVRAKSALFRSVFEAEARSLRADTPGLLVGIWQRLDYNNELQLAQLNTMRAWVGCGSPAEILR